MPSLNSEEWIVAMGDQFPEVFIGSHVVSEYLHMAHYVKKKAAKFFKIHSVNWIYEMQSSA